ncbi:protein ORF62 [Cyprinid herpesvirus 1]|uniref:Protein ORF62 n=1 Tax=Cyprinid herpesvirus 1 TaxID=317858 RepID=K7PBL3_9VIRU|nr:protein ORF62 [Cyprinid herpesvirus 1]AFJ20361.1 protein ORF62 [Cyprinid herpesvirus 1]
MDLMDQYMMFEGALSTNVPGAQEGVADGDAAAAGDQPTPVSPTVATSQQQQQLLRAPAPWDAWSLPEERRSSIKCGYAFHMRPNPTGEWDHVWNRYLWLNTGELHPAGPSVLTELPESVHMCMIYYGVRRISVPFKMLFDLAAVAVDVPDVPPDAFKVVTLPRSKNISRSSQLVTASHVCTQAYSVRTRSASELRLYQDKDFLDVNFLVPENTEDHVLLKLEQNGHVYPNVALKHGEVGNYGLAFTGWTEHQVKTHEKRLHAMEQELASMIKVQTNEMLPKGKSLDPYAIRLKQLRIKALKRKLTAATASRRLVKSKTLQAKQATRNISLDLPKYQHPPASNDIYVPSSRFLRKRTMMSRVRLPKSEDGMAAIIRLINRHEHLSIRPKPTDPGSVPLTKLDPNFTIDMYMDGTTPRDAANMQDNSPHSGSEDEIEGEHSAASPDAVHMAEVSPKAPSPGSPVPPYRDSPVSPTVVASQQLPAEQSEAMQRDTSAPLLPDPDTYALEYTFAQAKYNSYFRRARACIFAYAARLGLTLKGTRSDGNCLFYCLAHLMLGSVKRYMDIKGISKKWIIKNYDSPLVTYESFDRYITDREEDNGAWGEMVDIQACADFFSVNINVITASDVMSDNKVVVYMITVKPRNNAPSKGNVFIRYLQNHYDYFVPSAVPFSHQRWINLTNAFCSKYSIESHLASVFGRYPPPPQGKALSGKLSLSDADYEDVGDSASQVGRGPEPVTEDYDLAAITDVGVSASSRLFSSNSTARTAYTGTLLDAEVPFPADVSLSSYINFGDPSHLNRQSLEEAVTAVIMQMAESGHVKTIHVAADEMADSNDPPLSEEQIEACLAPIAKGQSPFDRAVEILRDHTSKPKSTGDQMQVFQDPPGLLYKGFFFNFYEMAWARKFGPLSRIPIDKAPRSVYRNASWILGRLMPPADESSIYSTVLGGYEVYERSVLGTCSGWVTVTGGSIPMDTKKNRSEFPCLSYLNTEKPMRFPTPFTSMGPHLAMCGSRMGLACGRAGFDPTIVCSMIPSVCNNGWNDTIINQSSPVETVLALSIVLGMNLIEFEHLSSNMGITGQAYRVACSHMGLTRGITLTETRTKLQKIHRLWGLLEPPENPSSCFNNSYLKLLSLDPEHCAKGDLVNQLFLDALQIRSPEDKAAYDLFKVARPQNRQHRPLEALNVVNLPQDELNAIESTADLHENILGMMFYEPAATFEWKFYDTEPGPYAAKVWQAYSDLHTIPASTYIKDKRPIARNIVQLLNGGNPTSILMVDNMVVDLVRTACYLQYLSGVTSFSVIAAKHYDVRPETVLAVCINLAGAGDFAGKPEIFDIASSYAAYHHLTVMTTFGYVPPLEPVDLRMLHCVKPEDRIITAAQLLLPHRLDRNNHSELVKDRDVVKVLHREIDCNHVLACVDAFGQMADYYTAFWSGEVCQYDPEMLVTFLLIMFVKNKCTMEETDSHTASFLSWKDETIMERIKSKSMSLPVLQVPNEDFLEPVVQAVNAGVADFTAIEDFIRTHVRRWMGILVGKSTYPVHLENVIEYCDSVKDLKGLARVLKNLMGQVQAYFFEYNDVPKVSFAEYQQVIRGWPPLFTTTLTGAQIQPRDKQPPIPLYKPLGEAGFKLNQDLMSPSAPDEPMVEEHAVLSPGTPPLSPTSPQQVEPPQETEKRSTPSPAQPSPSPAAASSPGPVSPAQLSEGSPAPSPAVLSDASSPVPEEPQPQAQPEPQVQPQAQPSPPPPEPPTPQELMMQELLEKYRDEIESAKKVRILDAQRHGINRGMVVTFPCETRYELPSLLFAKVGPFEIPSRHLEVEKPTLPKWQTADVNVLLSEPPNWAAQYVHTFWMRQPSDPPTAREVGCLPYLYKKPPSSLLKIYSMTLGIEAIARVASSSWSGKNDMDILSVLYSANYNYCLLLVVLFRYGVQLKELRSNMRLLRDYALTYILNSPSWTRMHGGIMPELTAAALETLQPVSKEDATAALNFAQSDPFMLGKKCLSDLELGVDDLKNMITVWNDVRRSGQSHTAPGAFAFVPPAEGVVMRKVLQLPEVEHSQKALESMRKALSKIPPAPDPGPLPHPESEPEPVPRRVVSDPLIKIEEQLRILNSPEVPLPGSPGAPVSATVPEELPVLDDLTTKTKTKRSQDHRSKSNPLQRKDKKKDNATSKSKKTSKRDLRRLEEDAKMEEEMETLRQEAEASGVLEPRKQSAAAEHMDTSKQQTHQVPDDQSWISVPKIADAVAQWESFWDLCCYCLWVCSDKQTRESGLGPVWSSINITEANAVLSLLSQPKDRLAESADILRESPAAWGHMVRTHKGWPKGGPLWTQFVSTETESTLVGVAIESFSGCVSYIMGTVDSPFMLSSTCPLSFCIWNDIGVTESMIKSLMVSQPAASAAISIRASRTVRCVAWVHALGFEDHKEIFCNAVDSLDVDIGPQEIIEQLPPRLATPRTDMDDDDDINLESLGMDTIKLLDVTAITDILSIMQGESPEKVEENRKSVIEANSSVQVNRALGPSEPAPPLVNPAGSEESQQQHQAQVLAGPNGNTTRLPNRKDRRAIREAQGVKLSKPIAAPRKDKPQAAESTVVPQEPPTLPPVVVAQPVVVDEEPPLPMIEEEQEEEEEQSVPPPSVNSYGDNRDEDAFSETYDPNEYNNVENPGQDQPLSAFFGSNFLGVNNESIFSSGSGGNPGSPGGPGGGSGGSGDGGGSGGSGGSSGGSGGRGGAGPVFGGVVPLITGGLGGDGLTGRTFNSGGSRANRPTRANRTVDLTQYIISSNSGIGVYQDAYDAETRKMICMGLPAQIYPTDNLGRHRRSGTPFPVFNAPAQPQFGYFDPIAPYSVWLNQALLNPGGATAPHPIPTIMSMAGNPNTQKIAYPVNSYVQREFRPVRLMWNMPSRAILYTHMTDCVYWCLNNFEQMGVECVIALGQYCCMINTAEFFYILNNIEYFNQMTPEQSMVYHILWGTMLFPSDHVYNGMDMTPYQLTATTDISDRMAFILSLDAILSTDDATAAGMLANGNGLGHGPAEWALVFELVVELCKAADYGAGSPESYTLIGIYLREMLLINQGNTFNIIMRLGTLFESMRRTHLYEKHYMGYDFMLGGLTSADNAPCCDGTAMPVRDTEAWRFSSSSRNTSFFYLSGLQKLVFGPGSMGTRAALLDMPLDRDRELFKNGINRCNPMLIPRPMCYMGPAYYSAQQSVFCGGSGHNRLTYLPIMQSLSKSILKYYSVSQPHCGRIGQVGDKGWCVGQTEPLRRRPYFDDKIYEPPSEVDSKDGDFKRVFVTSAANFKQSSGGSVSEPIRAGIVVSTFDVAAILGLQVAKVNSRDLIIDADVNDFITDPQYFGLRAVDEELFSPLIDTVIRIRAGATAHDMDLSLFGYPLFHSDGAIATFGETQLAWTGDYKVAKMHFNITEISTLLGFELTRIENRVLSDWVRTAKLTVNQSAFLQCCMVVLQHQPDVKGTTKLEYGTEYRVDGPRRLKAIGYSDIRIAMLTKIVNLFMIMNSQCKQFTTVDHAKPLQSLANFHITLNLTIAHTAATLGLLDLIGKVIFKVPFMNGVQCLAPVSLSSLLKTGYAIHKRVGQKTEAQMTVRRMETSKNNRGNYIFNGDYVNTVM